MSAYVFDTNRSEPNSHPANPGKTRLCITMIHTYIHTHIISILFFLIFPNTQTHLSRYPTISLSILTHPTPKVKESLTLQPSNPLALHSSQSTTPSSSHPKHHLLTPSASLKTAPHRPHFLPPSTKSTKRGGQLHALEEDFIRCA